MAQEYKQHQKFHIKKGDKVVVISGDHKGKEGVVTQMLREKNRAIVEGVNLVKKHIKPTSQNPEGSIVSMEAGIHISNLMLIDPKTGKPTRTGRKPDEKTGKLKRYSKESGQFID